MAYEAPDIMNVFCHRCKEVRWHEQMKCTKCGNMKHIIELVCTYSDSDEVLTLPTHTMPTHQGTL